MLSYSLGLQRRHGAVQVPCFHWQVEPLLPSTLGEAGEGQRAGIARRQSGARAKPGFPTGAHFQAPCMNITHAKGTLPRRTASTEGDMAPLSRHSARPLLPHSWQLRLLRAQPAGLPGSLCHCVHFTGQGCWSLQAAAHSKFSFLPPVSALLPRGYSRI